MSSSVRRISVNRPRSGTDALDTFDLLQHFQVQLPQRQVRILAVQATPDQTHRQFTRVEHHLDALSGRQVAQQTELLFINWVKPLGGHRHAPGARFAGYQSGPLSLRL